MVGVTGFEPMADREKTWSPCSLFRFAILPVFLFLRLAVSATGGARLRHLVPHIGSGLSGSDVFKPIQIIKESNTKKCWILLWSE